MVCGNRLAVSLRRVRLHRTQILITCAAAGSLRARHLTVQKERKILQECANLINQGKLSLHLIETFPLEEAVAADKALERRSTTGKIALIIS